MKKRNRKYKPKPSGSTRAIRLIAMKEDYEEIENVFEQLKRGEVMLKLKSTPKTNTKEFAEYCEACERWASDNGFYWE